MNTNRLVRELENATWELLNAADANLDRVEKLLTCRAAVLARIAACNPGEFTAAELASLRRAARDGEAALERLTLRRAAVDNRRCSVPGTISIAG